MTYASPRRRFNCPALLAGALLLAVLGVAAPATAQFEVTCFASGSLGLVPTGGFSCAGGLQPGDQIDISYVFTNTSTDAAANPVAITLQEEMGGGGITTATLACDDTPCAVTLPGTLTFVPVGGNGCVSNAPGVNSCTWDGSNQVFIDYTGGGVAVGAGAAVTLATIRVQASAGVGGASCGIFGSRADTGDDDIHTTDPVCDNVATGGAAGSGNLFYPDCTDDMQCDDGVFCNGGEFCDTGATGQCQPGTPPDCDDGVACTTDMCDTATDMCVNTPDDAQCDDGAFCNGVETCDPNNDCQAGTPVDCDDGDICTDDSCNEQTDQCDNIFDPDNDPSCNGAPTVPGAGLLLLFVLLSAASLVALRQRTSS